MTRFAYFHICDQVRREDNGKQILIGLYRQAIVFQKLPAKLTSLAVLPFLRCTVDDIPKEIFFRIIFPGGKELNSKTLSIEDSQIEAFRSDKENKFVDFSMNWVISPCDFPVAGRLKIFSVADGQEVYAGAMRIEQLDQVQSASFSTAEELVVLAHYQKLGTKEGREASKKLVEFLGNAQLESAEVKSFLNHLILTARIDDKSFIAFAAEPVEKWSRDQISGLPDSTKIKFKETHPLYCVFTVNPPADESANVMVDRPKR